MTLRIEDLEAARKFVDAAISSARAAKSLAIRGIPDEAKVEEALALQAVLKAVDLLTPAWDDGVGVDRRT